MKIRLATLTDLEAIARLHVASWDASFSQFAPEIVKARGDQYPKRLASWRDILSGDDTFTYVAVDNDEIIGFGQGSDVDTDWDLPQYDGEINRLYIAPNTQGRGIGKALINQVATTLQQQGKKSIVVAAWTINKPARAVYEHLGGQFIKEVPQEWQGFNNSQTVYAWDDINTLIEATQS